MKLQDFVTLSLVVALSGCIATREAAGGSAGHSMDARPSADHALPTTNSGRLDGYLKLATLKRAAQYPWLDAGRCAVESSSDGWEMVVQRCYRQLDLARIKFANPAHQLSRAPKSTCSFEQAPRTGPPHTPSDERSRPLVVRRALLFDLGTVGAAAGLLAGTAVPEAAGICMLLLPEVVGAVIVVGAAVVVGYVIFEAINELSKDTPPATGQELALEPKPSVDPVPSGVSTEPREKRKPGRIYVTYTKLNARTNLYYSGRTSMVIDPTLPLRLQAIAAIRARDQNHHVDENDEPPGSAFQPAELDEFDVGTAVNYEGRYSDAAYLRIRGREQQLIDYHGGSQADTGTPSGPRM